jgi:hypothetical protein
MIILHGVLVALYTAFSFEKRVLTFATVLFNHRRASYFAWLGGTYNRIRQHGAARSFLLHNPLVLLKERLR